MLKEQFLRPTSGFLKARNQRERAHVGRVQGVLGKQSNAWITKP